MGQSAFLSREIGHNSYRRIKGFDFKLGKEYWAKTKDYWADVRKVWSEIIKKNSSFELHKKVDGKVLFMYHFEQAVDAQVLALSPKKRYDLVKTTILKFVK